MTVKYGGFETTEKYIFIFFFLDISPFSFPLSSLLPFPISDRFVTSQHALQENITQFEQQTITQQPFDQQSLSQG